MQKEWAERIPLSIWIHSNRHVNKLKRFGNIEYISKKMNYVVLYVDFDKKDDIIEKIKSLHFVKKIDEFHRLEMSMDFQQSLEDYGETIEENSISKLMST